MIKAIVLLDDSNNVRTVYGETLATELPNDSTKYLNGTGNFSVPPGGGGSFLSTNIARVDATGSDDTGTVGDLTKPFLTVQAAINAIAPSGNGVIYTGANTFSEDLVLDIGTNDLIISFVGERSSGSFDYQAFQSFSITAHNCELWMRDVGGNVTNITADAASFFVYLDNVDLGGSVEISNTRTASILAVGSRSNSAGNIYKISGDSANFITVFGVWPSDSGSEISMATPTGISPTVKVFGCSHYGQPDSEAFQQSWSINAPGAMATVVQSILNNVTAAGGTFIDSRANGTITTDTPITESDVFLNPALMDFSTCPQATSEPSIPIGRAWIDTTAGTNIVKVKLS